MSLSLRPSEPTQEEINSLQHTIDKSLSSDASSCYYFDQKHFHSFQGVSFLGPLHSCIGCGKRVSPTVTTFGSTPKAVQCRACGEYAHRHCAVSKSVKWDKANFCTVNCPKSDTEPNASESASGINVKKFSLWSPFGRKTANVSETPVVSVIDQSIDSDSDKESSQDDRKNIFRLRQSQENNQLHDKDDIIIQSVPSDSIQPTIQRSYTWNESTTTELKTDDGHVRWATEEEEEDSENTLSSNHKENGGVHFVSHQFSTVSRALHQNVIAHFQPVVDKILSKDKSEIADSNQEESEEEEKEESNQIDETFHQKLSRTASVDSEAASEAQVEGLLQEENVEANNTKRLGIVAVAGGIAGGWAGLMLAGPVGGVIGGKVGQAIGISSIVLEGSVGIGVLASGIAAGRHAGQQLQDKIDENRVLALGDGTKQRILLVRPSVFVDPEWEDIYVKTRKSHKSFGGIFPLEKKMAKKQRYEREMDIIKTDEDELATADKVLLLVSRILNNRESLPGFVYQKLVQTLQERSKARGPLYKIFAEMEVATSEEEHADSITKNLSLRRARRQDAHAVIKYVTATLLEVRPGFSASANITELTASAVESLVFGEVYDLVIEEIEADYSRQDNALLGKIADFERNQLSSEAAKIRYKACVSEAALEALFNMPEAHSAVDKLRYSTFFLERISDFFSKSNSKKSSMGADSLLKLVCQHILIAKVYGINAQIAFLEEFARDETLLRGREGYALVTLQASLHFLNASEDFMTDIFDQEDD